MKLTEIVVASGNKDKIREIKQIFGDVKITSMKELGFDG
ncbi:MAG: non-canonical purine NTP pyrophosphatase, partial [Clostridia bacterium]|nr:non-canonical purine NTP pyrophosphatase [Clostridia bacterium]